MNVIVGTEPLTVWPGPSAPEAAGAGYLGRALAARAQGGLGTVARAQGRYADAEPLLRQALDRAAHAALLERLGRRDEAEAFLRVAIPALARAFGPGHHDVEANTNNLAVILARRDELAEAEARHRRAIGVLEAGVDPAHPHLARTRANCEALLRAEGEAVPCPSASS